MTHELVQWREEILPRIHTISDEMKWLYSEEANLSHYRQLAEYFEKRFNDEDLAKSAFLHGVPVANLRRILEPCQANEDVFAILDEREKLRALNMEDLDVNEPLLSEVLRSLRRARSIVLFVVEQLHHLDPDGKIATWSLRFHRSPGPLPPPLERGPRYKYGYDRENLPNFSRNVVAPTAKFFGLWRERNVIEDATLLTSQPDRFESLYQFAIQESRPDGECKKLVEHITNRLTDLLKGGQIDNIRWEWRHIGSLHRQLPQSTTPDWRRLLYRAGYVSVTCRESEDCYRALCRLHSQMSYRPTELRDTVGEATSSGYRALHTTLTPPGFVGLLTEAIPVRLLPREDSPVRRHRFDRRRLEELEKRMNSVRGMDLHVFTPDGRRVELPVGATVLDFAYALNNKWVAYLEGATINRQPVDVLHPLKPNDIVWLALSKNPRPLPHGWEKRVHPSRAPKIKKMFKQYFAPALEIAGRSWLGQRLFAKGISEPPADNDLDAFLVEAVDSLDHFKERGQDGRQIWRQLGLLSSLERGEELPFHLRIDAPLAEKIVEATVQAIQSAHLITLNELEIPDQLNFKLEVVVRCERCEPSLQGPLMGTVIDDRTLQLHNAGSPCAHGGIRVSRSRLAPARPQYLVVQTTNRIGVASEILSCFKRQRVNVAEIMASELAAGWGIVRVRVDYLGRAKLEEIQRELRLISGVSRVVGPDEPEIPALETALPPRRIPAASGWTPPPPYICGSDITDDAYFYGMQAEKALLRRVWDEASKSTSQGGRTVFVYGPKRVGKTSLVNCFLRELERSSHLPCITVYHEAAPGLSWEDTERIFTQRLQLRINDLAKQRGMVVPSSASNSFFDLVGFARTGLGASTAFVIDEAVGLLESCITSPGSISTFRSRIQLQPGLLVLWVGPEAPVLQLPESLRQVVQRSELLPIEGLNREEVMALLRAEKLSPKYQIDPSETVAKSVHRMTQGNPYWVSFLGIEMWKVARRRSKGLVHYDSLLLKRAKLRLFDLRLPFASRLSAEAGVLEGITGKILTMLAAQEQNPISTSKGLNKNEILATLSLAEPTLTPQGLESKLEELRARGALSKTLGGSGLPTWRISAPILAEYINYRQSATDTGRRNDYTL